MRQIENVQVVVRFVDAPLEQGTVYVLVIDVPVFHPR